MKLVSRIVSAVYVTILSLAPLYTMEAPATEPTYRFVCTISDKFVTGVVTFVKQISDQHLVIFNNNGSGFLYDLKNNYKCIKQWHLGSKVYCLKNIFLYQSPKTGQALLVAYGTNYKELYVCGLNSKRDIFPSPICINFPCKLVQAMVDSKKALVMINTQDNSAYNIDFSYADCDEKFILIKEKSILGFCQEMIIQEGLLVDTDMYQAHWKQFRLSPEIFNLNTITTQDDKKLLLVGHDLANPSLRDPWSYQVTPKMLYVGHDGLTSVWCLENNNEELL